MRKKGPPCIRNIKTFEKSGCPEQSWNGSYGCSAWCEIPYDSVDPEKGTKIVKACVDMIQLDIGIKTLALLEGNQQATESLRNGMCEQTPNGIRPKSSLTLEQFIVTITQAHNAKLIGK